MKKNKQQQGKTSQPNAIAHGLPVHRASDFKVIYTNFGQSGFTAFDISLVLGDVNANETGVISLEQRARVIMSPVEAKLILHLLASTIQQWEAQFGPIQAPKGIAAEEPQFTKMEGD